MGYYGAADLPFYYSLGRTFTLCDRWFLLDDGPDRTRTAAS